MNTKLIELPVIPLIESVDKLFLHFLVGKKGISQEDKYNDGLSEIDFNDTALEIQSELILIPNGRHHRILLDVEKKRVIREKEDKRLNDKRNALLTRYFQQSLLKAINVRLEDSDTVIFEQLQLHDSTLELLRTLIGGEPRYSILAALLEQNIGIKKHLLALVDSEKFMNELDRSPRHVRDIQSAVGLIGTDVLRYLVPAILFKYRISAYSRHNTQFAKKLWRYGLTLGQTCTALMIADNYRRPYEGMLLSTMINFAYVASYQQYLSSFEVVRNNCLEKAQEKGDKSQHKFFYNIDTDPASLKALLLSQSNLKLSLSLSEKLFSKSFPHLINALREEIEITPYRERSRLGQILFKAVRFAKYDQLRSSRLFKEEWLEKYIKESHIERDVYKNLVNEELFRFKPAW
ncbi:MAG: HDOD domain-containing protein [Psychromonas sp.]